MFYVYEWYITYTNKVFYVGKGQGARVKCLKASERNKLFWEVYNNNNCASRIVKTFESEAEAYNYERELIFKYKSQNEAYANIHEGGKGGNTLKYADDSTKQVFVDKMTQINRQRCKTAEFRQATGERATAYYKEPKNRERQSEKLKEVWESESLRKRHSQIIKGTYTDELREVRSKARKKEVYLEFQGETRIFPSRLELVEYLTQTYSFTPSNKTLAKLFKGESYKPYHKKHKHLQGLKVYYTK